MRNGQMWYGDRGDPIQAHGGMILRHGEKWYWYGENKDGPTKIVPGELNRVDVIGISCYSSLDLVNWHYEGLALRPMDTGMLCRENVCERPKVIYNKKTGKFVIWFHCDTTDYVYAGVGVAVSDTLTGPFELLYTGRPNRQVAGILPSSRMQTVRPG